jgi:hypothetical protein
MKSVIASAEKMLILYKMIIIEPIPQGKELSEE